MVQSHQDEHKPEKKKQPAKETPEQIRERKSKSLRDSVAQLRGQATRAALKQAKLQQIEDDRHLADGKYTPKPVSIKIDDPAIMFDYDADHGTLRRWVGSLKLDEVEKVFEGEIKKVEEENKREMKVFVDAQPEEKKRLIEGLEAKQKQSLEEQAAKLDQQTKQMRDVLARHQAADELRQEKKEELKEAKEAAVAAHGKVQEFVENVARVERLYREAQNRPGVLEATKKDLKIDPIAYAQETNRIIEAARLAHEAAKEEHVKATEAETAALQAIARAEEALRQSGEAVDLALAEIKNVSEEHERSEREITTEMHRIEDEAPGIRDRAVAAFELKNTQDVAKMDAEAKKKIDELNKKLSEVKSFEQEIKDIRNGWVSGGSVELTKMQEKVDGLSGLLEDKAIADAMDPEELKGVKEQLNKSTEVMDQEIAYLETKTSAHAFSRWTAGTREGAIEQEILYGKLENKQDKEKKHCDFVQTAAPPEERTMNDLIQAGSDRAYVIAATGHGTDQALYYINSGTRECKLVCTADSDEMKALLIEIKKGDALASKERYMHKALHPLTMRPLQTPGVPGSAGTVLTAMQEQHIRELVHHVRQAEDIKATTEELDKLVDWSQADDIKSLNPYNKEKFDPKTDWKAILPIAIVGPNDYEIEKQRRELEEAEDPRKARDKAIDRLMEAQKKEGQCEYDYKGETFKVQSVTDDKGKTSFSVVHHRGLVRSNNVKDAMAKMVALCYMNDPSCSIELDCGEISHRSSSYAKRMVLELEHAIIAAEKSRLAGVYVGITLGANALDALRAEGGEKDLERRAASLYRDWEKFVEGGLKEEKKAAEEKVEVSALGKLLGEVPPEVALGPSAKAAEVKTIFEGKTDQQKVDMMGAEVKKLESKVTQFEAQTKQIANDLAAVEKEIKAATADPDPAALDRDKLQKQFDKLASLEAAQKAVNKELLKLAEGVVDNKAVPDGQRGVAGNYAAWLRSNDIQEELKRDPGFMGQAAAHANAAEEVGNTALAKYTANQVGSPANNNLHDIDNHRREIVRHYPTVALSKAPVITPSEEAAAGDDLDHKHASPRM